MAYFGLLDTNFLALSLLNLLSWKCFRTFMEKGPYPGSKFSTFIPFIPKYLAPLIWPKYNSHPCNLASNMEGGCSMPTAERLKGKGC